MNRVNKIISVLTVTLFMAMWISPLLSTTECNMDCCKAPMDSACDMDMATDICCPSVSECSDVIFIPVVTAPILKVNIDKDITAEYLSSIYNIPSYDNTYSVQPYYIKTYISAPPGFQIPLLV